MSYQVLARKWRPRDFSQMVGQGHVVRSLVNALDSERLHHAYLFTGTRGVGKTTLARILAKCLNCETGVTSRPCGECGACTEIDAGRFVDLVEVDAASRAKVDETRELMDNVQFAPARGRYKVYLIDEVHMFSGHSFNALLKTLEEPPPHVKFLLATTDPQKLPVTVLSRCLQFNLKRLPEEQISAQLRRVLEEEGSEFEAEALALIARAADGSMRDALSLLDQALAYCAGTLGNDEVRTMLGTLDRGHVRALLECLAGGDANGMMARIGQMAGEVPDFGDALGALLSELQRIAVLQLVPDVDAGEDEVEAAALKSLAERISPEDVQLYYQIGLTGRRDLPLAPDPRGGFEMLMLRMLAFRPVMSDESPNPAGRGPANTAQPVVRSEAPVTSAAPESASPEALSAENWRAVTERLGVTGMVRELALNTVFESHRGGVVRLHLAPAHAQLRGRTLEESLRLALAAYLKSEVRLEIGITEHDADTPATMRRRESDQRHAQAVESIERDPNVQAMQDVFNARVDKDGIRALDE